jgi:hypothetical protein
MDEVYAQGKGIKDFEAGIRSLTAIMQEIDKLKIRAGLVSEGGQDKGLAELESGDPKDKPVTLQELREMKTKLENTSPDQLQAMKILLQKEGQATEDMQNANSVSGSSVSAA